MKDLKSGVEKTSPGAGMLQQGIIVPELNLEFGNLTLLPISKPILKELVVKHLSETE